MRSTDHPHNDSPASAACLRGTLPRVRCARTGPRRLSDRFSSATRGASLAARTRTCHTASFRHCASETHTRLTAKAVSTFALPHRPNRALFGEVRARAEGSDVRVDNRRCDGLGWTAGARSAHQGAALVGRRELQEISVAVRDSDGGDAVQRPAREDIGGEPSSGSRTTRSL